MESFGDSTGLEHDVCLTTPNVLFSLRENAGRKGG